MESPLVMNRKRLTALNTVRLPPLPLNYATWLSLFQTAYLVLTLLPHALLRIISHGCTMTVAQFFSHSFCLVSSLMKQMVELLLMRISRTSQCLDAENQQLRGNESNRARPRCVWQQVAGQEHSRFSHNLMQRIMYAYLGTKLRAANCSIC